MDKVQLSGSALIVMDPATFNRKTMYKHLIKLGDLWTRVMGEGVDFSAALARLEAQRNSRKRR